MKPFSFLTLGLCRALVLAAAVMFGAVCVSNAVAQETAGSGTFTDKRDGKTYKTVKIGGQTWMAQNLNYQTDISWCGYGGCEKLGRLYKWNTAITVCPSGWHLPTDKEWDKLIKEVGGDSVAGKKLKATSGWDEKSNGTDEYGFAAMPGLGQDSVYSYIMMNTGDGGRWWTATDISGGVYAYNRVMYNGSDRVYENGLLKSSAFSVRCVED